MTPPPRRVRPEPEPMTWRGLIFFVLSDPHRFRRALLSLVVLGSFAVAAAALCGSAVTAAAIGATSSAIALAARRR